VAVRETRIARHCDGFPPRELSEVTHGALGRIPDWDQSDGTLRRRNRLSGGIAGAACRKAAARNRGKLLPVHVYQNGAALPTYPARWCCNAGETNPRTGRRREDFRPARSDLALGNAWVPLIRPDERVAARPVAGTGSPSVCRPVRVAAA
jgi:hypothetical protein